MLISCVTPVHVGRLDFMRVLAKCFMWQECLFDLEWVIVDDSPTDAIRDLLPNDSRIRYQHVPPCNIGTARNLCGEYSTGDYLVHMDSDDAYSPDFVQRSIEFHLFSGMKVTGLGSLVFHDLKSDSFSRFTFRDQWTSGLCMVYSRDTWSRYRFDDTTEAEDHKFQLKAVADCNSLEHDDRQEPVTVVSVSHANNSLSRSALKPWSTEATEPDWYASIRADATSK